MNTTRTSTRSPPRTDLPTITTDLPTFRREVMFFVFAFCGRCLSVALQGGHLFLFVSSLRNVFAPSLAYLRDVFSPASCPSRFVFPPPLASLAVCLPPASCVPRGLSVPAFCRCFTYGFVVCFSVDLICRADSGCRPDFPPVSGRFTGGYISFPFPPSLARLPPKTAPHGFENRKQAERNKKQGCLIGSP